MSRLSDELAGLATLSPAQLRAEWRRVLRTLPPPVPIDILQRGIAYRLQEKALGALPASIVRELARAGAGLAKGLPAAAALRLKPGSRLVRTWQDTTYPVLVTDDGFVMGDRRFVSLSQIAQTITGAHWSGPRFFGLKTPRVSRDQSASSSPAALAEVVDAS